MRKQTNKLWQHLSLKQLRDLEWFVHRAGVAVLGSTPRHRALAPLLGFDDVRQVDVVVVGWPLLKVGHPARAVILYFSAWILHHEQVISSSGSSRCQCRRQWRHRRRRRQRRRRLRPTFPRWRSRVVCPPIWLRKRRMFLFRGWKSWDRFNKKIVLTSLTMHLLQSSPSCGRVLCQVKKSWLIYPYLKVATFSALATIPMFFCFLFYQQSILVFSVVQLS